MPLTHAIRERERKRAQSFRKKYTYPSHTYIARSTLTHEQTTNTPRKTNTHARPLRKGTRAGLNFGGANERLTNHPPTAVRIEMHVFVSIYTYPSLYIHFISFLNIYNSMHHDNARNKPWQHGQQSTANTRNSGRPLDKNSIACT